MLLLLCILVVISAAVYLFSFWRSWNRPGMTFYLKGMDYLSAKQPALAEAEWIKGAKADPKDYHCFEALGDYYSTVLRLQDAADCYARAVTLHPAGKLYLDLAHAHQSMGDYGGAARAAKLAATLLPSDADAVGLYGMMEAKLKERTMAVALLTHACALDPSNRTYRMALALAEMDALDLPAAERDLRTCLKQRPDDPDASYYLCVIYNQKPKTPENIRAAIGFARAAAQGQPKSIRGYTALGQLYLSAGQPREALTTFLAGEKIAPNEEGVLHGLEDCYTRLGMKQEQAAAAQELQVVVTRHDRIEHLKHVMGYNHYDIASGLELAGLEAQDGKQTVAVGYYEQLIREFPHDMRPRRALSALFQKMGQTQLAKTALRLDMVP